MPDKKKQVLKLRSVSGGAQQWQRGSNDTDRASKVVDSAALARRKWEGAQSEEDRKKMRDARRLLLNAMDDEIKPVLVKINKGKMEKAGSTLRSLRPKPKAK
jgi:hypothetical protein